MVSPIKPDGIPVFGKNDVIFPVKSSMPLPVAYSKSTSDVKALHEKIITNLDFKDIWLHSKVNSSYATVEKILKKFVGVTDIEEKIAALDTEMYKLPKDAQLPFKCERARLYLMKNDPVSIRLALKDLALVGIQTSSPTIHYLKAKAHWLLDESFLMNIQDLLKISGKSVDETLKMLPEDASLLFNFYKSFHSFCSSDPKFNKSWEKLTSTKHYSIANTLHKFIQRGDSEDKIHRYLSETITRLEKIDEYSYITCGDRIEKFYFEATKTLPSAHVNKFLNGIVEMVFQHKSSAITAAHINKILDALLKKPQLCEGDLTETYSFLEELEKPSTPTALALTALDNFEKKNNPRELHEQVQKIAGVLQSTPFLLPQFLHLWEHEPDSVPLLVQSLALFGKDTFEYLIKTYVCDVRDEKGKYTTSLPVSFIQSILKNTFEQRQLLQLIEVERERGIKLLPLFFPDASRLHTILPQCLAENETFSRHINPLSDSSKDNFDVLCMKLKENKELVYRLYSILPFASGHNSTDIINILWRDKSIWDPSIEASAARQVFEEIRAVIKSHSNPAIKMPAAVKEKINALIMLVDENKIDLANQIIDLTDRAWKAQLFKLIEIGEIDLVEELLAMPPNGPLTNIIKSLATPSKGSLVRQLLKIQQQRHPLATLIAKEPSKSPLNPEVCALIKLYAQGDDKLLNIAINIKNKSLKARSSPEQRVLHLISEESFSLARACLNGTDEKFWKVLFAYPRLTAEEMQQVHNLHLLLKPAKLSSEIKDSMIRFTLYLLNTRPQEFEAWISGISIAIERNATGIEKAFLQWRAIERAGIKPSKAVEQLISNLLVLAKIDVEKINKTLSSCKTTKKMGVALAEMITTRNGRIDKYVISQLIPFIDTTDFKPYEKAHFKRVLTALQTDPSFSDRLATLQQAPEQNSRASNVIKSLNITSKNETHQAQIAVVSALLFPLYQSSVGSCFGTALAIQLNSFSDGLKQSLEDYIALVKHGCLTRQKGQTAINFPLSFDEDRFKADFQGDNFLVRAREFTIATMAGGPKIESFRDKWSDLTIFHLAKVLNVLNVHERTMLEGILDKTDPIGPLLKEEMAKRIHLRYFGHAKAKESGQCGAWVMVNQNEEPIVSKRELFENIFLDSLRAVYEKQQQSLNSEERKLFERVLLELMPKVVKTDFFLCKAADIDTKVTDIKTFFQFNLEDVRPSQFIEISGGHLVHTLQAYHNYPHVHIKYFNDDPNPLKSLFQYVHDLEALHQKQISKAPEYLQYFQSNEGAAHALNIQAGKIQQALKKAGGPEKILLLYEQLKEALFGTVVTPKIEAEILEQIKSLAINEFQYSHVEKEYNSLKAKHPILNLRDFSRLLGLAIIKACRDPDALYIAKRVLLHAISETPPFQKIFPPSTSVANTNWEIRSGISFNLDPIDEGFLMLYADSPDTGFYVEPPDWPTVSAWAFPDHHNLLDDYSRSYSPT